MYILSVIAQEFACVYYLLPVSSTVLVTIEGPTTILNEL